jgi:hypothetical protein
VNVSGTLNLVVEELDSRFGDPGVFELLVELESEREVISADGESGDGTVLMVVSGMRSMMGPLHLMWDGQG